MSEEHENRERKPVHESCTAHSGVESRQTTILWLLGILIGINILSAGWQFSALAQVKASLSETATQFVRGDAEDKALRVMIASFDQRIRSLEGAIKYSTR